MSEEIENKYKKLIDEVNKIEFLEKDNSVILKNGTKIRFGTWTNRQREASFLNAKKDSFVNTFEGDEKKQQMILKSRIWLLCHSILNGGNPKIGLKVEEIYEKVQDMDDDDGERLGRAFTEFEVNMLEGLKKKSQ